MLSPPVGQESEEANAHEAARRDVQQEAAKELLATDRHRPLLTPAGVVLPPEGHLTVRHVGNPVIGNGHSMGVTGQVMEDMLGSPEGRLGVDHPVRTKKRSQEEAEGLFLGEVAEAFGKGELPSRKARFRPAMNLPRNTRLRTFTGRKKA